MNAENKTRTAVEAVVRDNYGIILALLIKQLNDIQLSEDSLHDAITIALTRWKEPEQLPENIIGWLIKVAHRKAIDKLRRDQTFSKK